jgi:hypothetical protein
VSFCGNCGTEQQTGAESFCASCGTQFPGLATTPLVASVAGPSDGGRHVGYVALGLGLGFLLNLLTVISILVARLFGWNNKTEKDVLFGAWLGFGVHVVLVIMVVLALVGRGTGQSASSNRSSAPQRTYSGGAKLVPYVPPTAAPVVPQRTAPEILDALFALLPRFCPEYKLGGRADGSLYSSLSGPKQQPDGNWWVECMVISTSRTEQHIIWACEEVNSRSLEVKPVMNTSLKPVVDPVTGASVIGQPCL